jgi:hypothetical protein
MVKAWASLLNPHFPTPIKYTLCGLPGALSAIVAYAVRGPTALGSNLMAIEQLLPAGSDPVQLSVSEKFAVFVPVIVRPLISIVVLPLLVNCTVYGELVVFTFWFPKK